MPASVEGTVTKIEPSCSWVDAPEGRFKCELRGKLSRRLDLRLAVGDRVRVLPTDEDSSGSQGEKKEEPRRGVVEHVFPRRTVLQRARAFKRDQVVCANVDQILVVVSVLEPPYKRNFIDRLLIGIERENLEPVVVFNKLDLADDEYRPVVEDDARVYVKAGYRVVGASAVTGEGIDALREALRGKISAVAGPSGVGKSTLLNAIVPGLDLRTGDVSEAREGRGKHTTTSAELVKLPEGTGFVADTPGIRAFGLWNMEPRDVGPHFREIARVAAGCKFADCAHRDEPDCAVVPAVQSGEIDDERYDSYLKLRAELEAEEAARQANRKR